MARQRSGDAVLTQMEQRLREIDSELGDLSIFNDAGSPDVIFDRLEEHARLRVQMALELVPEKRGLRPVPANPDPAYIDRLGDYFDSLHHANGRARIAAEYAANDGGLAAGQLQYAIEGRRQLAEGKIGASVLYMYAVTREFYRHSERLPQALTSIRASSRVGRRRGGWDALGKERERRFRQLIAQGHTVAGAGRKIAREEKSRTTSGENVIRSVRRRIKKRGEPFPSPTRQTPKSTN